MQGDRCIADRAASWRAPLREWSGKQGRAGFLRNADLAHAMDRLAQARFHHGLVGDAAIAAREALKIYDRLIKNGRVGLAAEASGTRCCLGSACSGSATRPAAEALATALRAYESMSDRDLDLSMPGRHRTSRMGVSCSGQSRLSRS